MTSSLVGSEMCIRDRIQTRREEEKRDKRETERERDEGKEERREGEDRDCLLYTSDAADDM
eukprot:9378416-Prorocentrum_lima.AAC.1